MNFAPLTILYLDALPLDTGINTAMLNSYLVNRGRSDISVRFHTPIDDTWVRHYDFVTIMPELHGKDAILQYAREQNVDIIHDPHGGFSKRERLAEYDSFLFTSDSSELNIQIEAYLAGHEVVWLTNHSIVNARWIQKYNLRGGLTHDAFQFLSTAQHKGYSSSQVQFVRSLLNKIMHIEYSRDLLYHYLILKRRATRLGDGGYYNFELMHHMTNYTFSICSAMDVLSRLLNDLYGLGYFVGNNYGIEKPDFITRLSRKRKTLADIFALKKYNTWGRLIKIRRNEFTHSSQVYLTPLVMEKDEADKLSDEELETLVDRQLERDGLEPIDGVDEVMEAIRATLRQELDLEHNYKKIADDIMTLEMKDEATGEIRQHIVRPLLMIDDDFYKISKLMERAFANLSRARARK